jgi:hypothetical protein
MNAKTLCIAGGAAFLATFLAAAQDVLPKPEEAFKAQRSGARTKIQHRGRSPSRRALLAPPTS